MGIGHSLNSVEAKEGEDGWTFYGVLSRDIRVQCCSQIQMKCQFHSFYPEYKNVEIVVIISILTVLVKPGFNLQLEIHLQIHEPCKFSLL